MNTPYAAKNPSVSAVRPNSRAMIDADDRSEAGLNRDRERGDGSRREGAQAGRDAYACSTDAEA